MRAASRGGERTRRFAPRTALAVRAARGNLGSLRSSAPSTTALRGTPCACPDGWVAGDEKARARASRTMKCGRGDIRRASLCRCASAKSSSLASNTPLCATLSSNNHRPPRSSRRVSRGRGGESGPPCERGRDGLRPAASVGRTGSARQRRARPRRSGVRPRHPETGLAGQWRFSGTPPCPPDCHGG